ncbi:histidinol-phosphatase [Kiloniella laminariae]|uniref:Histidinol-phosphatase n=1 Tax=Kiloniella laminariae TaxID=454162 RepID=A0ABT4LKH0_9PROT|nr:histidinol-phosphatase [Kiloniella laminariae]MCZ4281579.1 histidinol-phosphatase [Kiloniella laminariae]
MVTDFNCPAEYTELGEQLCDAARSIILEYFRSPLTVEGKSDASPVTIADRSAETAMREMINKHYPDHGIIGEEHGSEKQDAEFVWVLDPIDGTKSFISGHAIFGTLVALLRNNQPVMGILSMPVINERWIGAAGQATLFRDHRGTNEVRVRECSGLAQATLATTSPLLFKQDQFPKYDAARARAKMNLFGGDCYNYGLVASGSIDLTIEAGMGVYDYLAQVPILTGAGGIMSDWEGKPLGMHSDGKVITSGDHRLHQEVLELFNG